MNLEIVTTVFDGYVDIPVPIPTTVFRNGKQVPLEDGEKFVVVKGNPKFNLPVDCHYWNRQHGCTGWLCDLPEEYPRKMFKNTEYAVLESWYEKHK